MNRHRFGRFTLVVLGALVATVLVASTGTAITQSGRGGGAPVHRPLSDFLNAQGSTNIFIPPIPDFVGWTDNPPNGCNLTHFASVDYAGVAASWLVANGGPNVGTHSVGSVTERALPDGRANVIVDVTTFNAISWCLQVPINDLANDPAAYGYRATELLANPSLKPSLSTGQLHAEFTNTAPGAPLPDLVLFIIGAAQPGQSLTNLSFRSSGSGTLHAASGFPEGTSGSMTIEETGLLTHVFQGCPSDAFPVERVSLQATGGSATGLAPASRLQSASPGGTSTSTWGRLQILYR